MDGKNESQEISVFNRYISLLEEQDRIADDIKALDIEVKTCGVENGASIKRLAGLYVKGRIGKEVMRFRALEAAASRCEQLKLFTEL